MFNTLQLSVLVGVALQGSPLSSYLPPPDINSKYLGVLASHTEPSVYNDSDYKPVRMIILAADYQAEIVLLGETGPVSPVC